MAGNTISHSTLQAGYDFFIKDRWNNKYHFKISTFPVPSGLLSEAVEVMDAKPTHEPYIFTILSGFDADVEYAELMLKAKLIKGINKHYLKKENGKLSIGDDRELAGRIEFDETGSEKVFIIDGKAISIEQFIDMIQPYQGWSFKFQVYDPTDEKPGGD
jgi:hypothetical protein